MAALSRLRGLRREHPAFVALSALTVAVLLGWHVVDFYLREMELVTPFGFNDFGVYAGTLTRWESGGAVYVQDEVGGYHGSYLYPPITLLFFTPFASFEFVTGAILFGAASFVLLWVGLEAVGDVFGLRLAPGERLVLVAALFAFQPALRDFKWARLSTFLTGLLCLAFYAQERGVAADSAGRLYRFGSGALTTLGSCFKLFFATSGAHLLRDRVRFAGAMAAAGTLLVLSLAVFGVEPHREYLDVLLWGKGWGETSPTYLWDTSAAYRPLTVFGSLGLPLRILGILGVVGLTLATRTVETAAVRRSTFALGVAVVPLFAPHADSHDLVVMLLPAAIMLGVELNRSRGLPWLPVLSVLLFHLHRYVIEVAIYPPDWLPLAGFVSEHAPWFQPGMWATFLLVGLAAARVAEHASAPSGVSLRPSRRSGRL